MRAIRAMGVVFAFEWRRAAGWSRLVIMLALAAFPATILWLIRHAGGDLPSSEARAIALFVMIPELVCLLALLLWATPVIHAEVEGKTWHYLVVRPAGKVPILLGKYAAAVTWSMITGWLALTLAMQVVGPRVQGPPPDPSQSESALPPAAQGFGRQEGLRTWAVMAALVALACTAYGALFVLLGVVFLRRGMIIAVAYTLLELAVRIIPSAIRQLTLQYHLQGLLIRWMGLSRGHREIDEWLGTADAWVHVAALVGIAAVLLGMAAAILRQRELVTANEV